MALRTVRKTEIKKEYGYVRVRRAIGNLGTGYGALASCSTICEK
jgi:hypothetical protein